MSQQPELLDDETGDQDQSRPSVQAVLLVLSAFLVGQATQVNDGHLHPAALGWIGLAIITLTAALVPAVCGRFELLSRLPIVGVFAVCLAIQLAELLAWDGGPAGARPDGLSGSLLLAGAGALLTISRPQLWRSGLAMLLIGHFLAGAATIQAYDQPRSDVWHFQDQSTAALLRGQDPYAVRFHDVYGSDFGFYAPGMSQDGWLMYSYPYPPLMLLLTAPGKLLGDDVRWAHLVALELSAALLVLAARRPHAVLAAAMMLLMPRSLLVIGVGWTEPMVLLTLSLVIFCARRFPAGLWLALGLFFSIKQYTILAAPLVLLMMPRRELARTMMRSAAIAACTMLPFFLWNPVSFVRSVVLWQLRQPFRTDALSFPAMVDARFGLRVGVWLCLAAIGCVLWLAYRKAPRGLLGMVMSLALLLLVFFATNKQAFCNYYFLVIGVVCASAAMINARTGLLRFGPGLVHERRQELPIIIK